MKEIFFPQERRKFGYVKAQVSPRDFSSGISRDSGRPHDPVSTVESRSRRNRSPRANCDIPIPSKLFPLQDRYPDLFRISTAQYIVVVVSVNPVICRSRALQTYTINIHAPNPVQSRSSLFDVIKFLCKRVFIRTSADHLPIFLCAIFC